MRSDDNLPPGCTARDVETRDVETRGTPFVRYGGRRRATGEPLTVEKARQLWAQYGRMFDRERQAELDRKIAI